MDNSDQRGIDPNCTGSQVGTTASVGAAWRTNATAGATGTGTATLSSAERNGGILIALKPLALTATTTTLAAGGTSTYGAAVTFTATVTPSAAAGTVNFYDGATLLGSGTLSSGTASYTTTGTQLSAGTHSSITAVYQGNSTYAASTSSAITQTVNPKALTALGTLSVPASKVYDGTTSASVTGSAALQAAEAVGSGTTSDGKPYTGDTVSLTGTPSYAYNSKDVATASAVNESGLSLTGAQSGNYTLTPPGLSATITPKALTVSGITAASTIYDGTTTAKLGGTAAFQAAEAAGAGHDQRRQALQRGHGFRGGTAAGTLAAKDVGSAGGDDHRGDGDGHGQRQLHSDAADRFDADRHGQGADGVGHHGGQHDL